MILLLSQIIYKVILKVRKIDLPILVFLNDKNESLNLKLVILYNLKLKILKINLLILYLPSDLYSNVSLYMVFLFLNTLP